tara:strand:+ start:153 stop:446 length:294 start_codon:yes stop_codon:yes gene_type:complete
MNIGDTVFQNYAGLHRYGKVIERRDNFKGDGWSWFKIDWVDDEKYVNSQQWKAKLRGEDKNHFVPDYYRADDIFSVDINQTLKTLIKLQNKPNANVE